MVAKDGDSWGNWTYRKDVFSLDFDRPGEPQYRYEINLEDCNSGSKILDWILQFSTKTWTTPEEVGSLVNAIDAVAGPGLQGKVCPFGDNESFNIKAFLTNN